MKAGWQIHPLQSLCENIKQDIVDGPFGSELQRKDYISEGIPVLKIQNIWPYSIELKMDYVSLQVSRVEAALYKRGDIVMTKLGDPLGCPQLSKISPMGLSLPT
jgi:type I restriction enzyme S subunit